MPSYVIVWENNTLGHRAVSGKTWPGHAALNIGGTFDSRKKRGKNGYVSWFPAEFADFNAKGVLKAVFTRPQAGVRHCYFDEDVDAETYLPDHIIRLDSSEESELKMLAAWKEVYLNGTLKYRNLRQNCSTIVARVLHAGGFHGKKWSVDNNWTWSPGDIRVLARSVGGAFTSWHDFKRILLTSGIDPSTLPYQTARSGRLCTTGVECAFQKGEQYHWRTK